MGGWEFCRSGSQQVGGSEQHSVLGAGGASCAPALINKLSRSGPGPKHIACSPWGLSTRGPRRVGAHQARVRPRDLRPEIRTEGEGGRPRNRSSLYSPGWRPLPSPGQGAASNIDLVLFSRCQGPRERRRGRRGREKSEGPPPKEAAPSPTCARPAGPR